MGERWANPGESFLGGIQAGAAIRGGFDKFRNDRETKELTKQYFEGLHGIGREETPDAGAIPVPDAGGSENMEAASGAANNKPVQAPVQAIPTADGEAAGGSLVEAAPERKRPRYRSATADDYTKLDNIAARLATISGDPKTYEAMRGTTKSFVQSKIMGDMGKAQVALQVGDTDGLEDAIHSMYRYVPDGQELKIKRDKDNNLMFKHPESGEFLPVNAQSLRMFGMGVLDPNAMEEMMYGRKKEAKADARADQGVANDTTNAGSQRLNAETSAKNAGTAAAQAAEVARHNRQEEEVARVKSKNDTLATGAHAAYELSYAHYLDGDKGKGAAITPDNAIKYSESVAGAVDEFLNPTQLKEGVDALGNKTFVKAPGKQPADFIAATPEQKLQMTSIAEKLGMANPDLGVRNAVGSAAEIMKALNGKGTVRVNPNTGQIGITIGGKDQVFKLSPELLQMITAERPAPGQPPVAGIPPAAPAATPMGLPAMR